MPLGIGWDGIGMPLGCRGGALSNVRTNLDMNMDIRSNTNTNPTINIHISRMP